jgi:Glu-tRNA(Gln) amidotransferase subunit E-like FAD-binding protein
MEAIIGYSELAKELAQQLIYKATLAGRNQLVFNLLDTVPPELTVATGAVVRQKLTKLGYKVRKLDSDKLLITWR